MRRSPLLLVLAALVAHPAPTNAQANAARVDDQRLNPGDVVRLSIWREPDMSGDFLVDEAGTVVFARLGEYLVLEDTPATLKARLVAEYSKFLREPNIDVTVLRRISILGAVNNPDSYLVDPTVTLADALAMAGGATSLGDPNRVMVIRNGSELPIDVNVEMRVGDSRIRSGDQIFVPERSWVSRNSNVVATALSASVALVIALFIR